MATTYEDAVTTLYRAPHDAFVAERTRLSEELKAQGDKAGAARFNKLRRPTVSAWAVNQLWWNARQDFETLFKSGARLKKGDLAATAEHRQALADLSARAKTLLGTAGHATSEGTLRRVTATLSALAATGSFDPDPPGALSADRDPPGFDSIELAAGALPKAALVAPDAREGEAERAREQAEATRDRALRAEQRARNVERQRIEAALRTARREAEVQTRKVERLRGELTAAEDALREEQNRLAELEKRLAELEAGD
jgi:hypothetical protein